MKAPQAQEARSAVFKSVKEPLRLRFALLSLVLFLVFAFSVGLLKVMESFEYDDIVGSERLARSELLRNWLDLRNASLRQFADDYSQWDDMVSFSKEPDPEWGRVNIDSSLKTFDACAAWVYDAAGRLVYEAKASGMGAPGLTPFTPEVLVCDFSQVDGHSFFLAASGQLYLLRVAHLRSSDDTTRSGPRLGWFVVARLWSGKEIASLSLLTGANVSLHLGEGRPLLSAQGARIDFEYPLRNWEGRTEARLVLTTRSGRVLAGLQHDVTQMVLMIGFGLVSIVMVIYCLRVWVLAPLSHIERALTHEDLGALAPLRRDRSELGRFASLVAELFEQRRRLSQEVSARRKAEQALRESESSLRRVMRERSELARNLHDGAIQTLFAAGMGVGGALSLLGRSPEEAAARIEQSRTMLNDVIRDLRAFITGLEAEEGTGGAALSDVLARMLEHMRAIREFTPILAIDPRAEAELSAGDKAQVLFIAREAVSNALRHGGASLLSISLSREPEQLCLEIVDDGVGIGSNLQSLSRGHGLPNMRQRANDMGGRLEILPASGHGTVIRLLIPLEEI